MNKVDPFYSAAAPAVPEPSRQPVPPTCLSVCSILAAQLLFGSRCSPHARCGPAHGVPPYSRENYQIRVFEVPAIFCTLSSSSVQRLHLEITSKYLTSLISCPQLLATAKNCCYNRVATLLLGGAELRMRISLDPGPRSSSPGYPAPCLRLEC